MRRRTRDDREAGFTLAETLVVVSIATVLAATVMAWSPGAADTLQGDANQRGVAGQLINAREIAINQRRSVEVRFIQPNIVQVWRHDLPAGTTLMSSATLED